MSEKKLLEESVIRRFQTLAGVKPIANGLVEEGKKSEKKPKPAGGRPAASGMSAKDAEERAAGKQGKAVEESLEEAYHEEEYMKEAEEAPEMGGEMEMGGGEEAAGGMEGGDVKAEVQALVDALNGLLAKVGQGELEVDVEAGGEEAGAEGGEAEAEAVMEDGFLEESEGLEEAKHKKEDKKKHGKDKEKEEEKMEESLDLEIDDEEYLAEELTKRVAARLVAEMKKAKAMKEGSKGGSWLNTPKHAKPPKAKGAPTKGKVGTPFGGGKKK